MGKDREGRFHPRKGKPSVASSNLNPISSSAFEGSREIADKYTIGEEEPAPNVRIRHPNRNVDKREERQQERSQMQDARTRRNAATVDRTGTAPALMLDVISKEIFSDLAAHRSRCCITIYFTTHPGGIEVNERVDPTAFKNALQQITASLRQTGFNDTTIESLLKPGYELLRNDKLWYNMSSGLAVFISDGIFKYMKLPYSPKDETMINTSFYIAPLIPLITNSDYFYLLVLSKKQAKLYQADAFGMKYIPVDGMPDGVDDVVHFEEKDDQKLWRTGSGGAGGGANYHGIGAGKPDDKENLAMYFDEVDETVRKEVLARENVPLLLAGVEYLIPIYRSVARYKPIWPEAITGSHEHEDADALYRLARLKMDPYFDERHKNALEAYANNSASELTSSIPEDVIPAAHYRRVWHLFVARDEHIWGTFDDKSNKLEIHETPLPGDECLIDKSIIQTILNAGEVHMLPRDRMPGKSVMAALMRY